MSVVLSADKTKINVGELVYFKISGLASGESWRLYKNNVAIDWFVTDLQYRFNEAGIFDIYGHAEYGEDTNHITIYVGDNYVLTASSEDYNVDNNGNVTIEITLINNDEPMGSETVTLTDEDSNSYAATTDSDGVATFNLTNITNSGVYTASYTSAEDISVNVIVHDYNLSFTSDNYYTCNGNVTISAELLDGNSPVSGETITLTGTGISTTGTTDSNGIATFNLSNINSNNTLTVTWEEDYTDECSLTYNNPNTLNGSLVCLGKKIVNNLKAKGVSNVDESDGLNTLANKILNIPASVGGIELVTAITCASSENSVTVGDTITLTGVLEADFDDTSSSNVDLEGFLSGAVVKFYNGQTLLGSAVTNSQGAYSFNYTPDTPGTLVLAAVFEGTTYYNACTSSTVSINVDYDITITVDKPILSAYDNETATITAGCGVAGETLSYSIEDSGGNVIDSGSDTTDSNGEITFTYAAAARGDVTVNVSLRSLVSKTYSIIDASFSDEMTSNAKQSRWTIPSAISSSSIFGYGNDGWKIGNASSYSHMFLEIDFNTPTSIEFQLNDYNSSTESPFMRICTPSHETLQNMFTVLYSNITFAGVNISRNAVKGAVYRIDIYSNQMKLYENDVLISTQSATPHSTFRIVNTTGTNRMMQWKNLIIKPL